MSTGNALALSETETRIAERIDQRGMDTLAVSSQAGGLAFASASEVMNFAKMMAVANSGVRKHLRGNVGACLAICTQAVEWGMSPFAVANKSYFVNDQIAFESQLVQAVILKRAPIKGRIKFEFTGTGAKRVCRAWARLADDPEEIVEYISPEFGLITPKNSPLWKADPDQQHAYYSGRALCRRHFPDVLLGVYGEDELAPPLPGAANARDVTPARGLSARLDALAGKPTQQEAEEAEVADDLEAQASAGEEPQAEPAIDPASPDYDRGFRDGEAGTKKCLSEEIRNDPGRLANWTAGHREGIEAREREGASA